MSTSATAATATKVVTGKVRLSYCHLFEPHAVEEGQDKKYSVSILIPKSDKDSLAKIQKAIDAVKKEATDKYGGKLPKNFKMPLRDGDEDREGDEAYAGHYFINCSSKQKPQVVDKDLNPILDQSEVYSGCYGRVSINFYSFDKSGNKGIACGLNNVQKLKDGAPLGGGSTAEQDFAEAIEMDEDDNDLL